jgi:hypothetical protein
MHTLSNSRYRPLDRHRYGLIDKSLTELNLDASFGHVMWSYLPQTWCDEVGRSRQYGTNKKLDNQIQAPYGHRFLTCKENNVSLQNRNHLGF